MSDEGGPRRAARRRAASASRPAAPQDASAPESPAPAGSDATSVAPSAASAPAASAVPAPDAPKTVTAAPAGGPAATPPTTTASAPTVAAKATGRRSVKADGRRWVDSAVDRIPAKWLVTAATGLFLAATAAFGGLATASEPELPVIGPGDTFIGAQLEMTPTRVTIADELRNSGVFPEEGERVITLWMQVTNLDTEPRTAMIGGSVAEVRIEGLPEPDRAPSIFRPADDKIDIPVLQPDVPTTVALSWLVSDADFAGVDEVRVDLHTAVKARGTSVTWGTYWTDIAVAGYADMPLEEVVSEEPEPDETFSDGTDSDGTAADGTDSGEDAG